MVGGCLNWHGARAKAAAGSSLDGSGEGGRIRLSGRLGSKDVRLIDAPERQAIRRCADDRRIDPVDLAGLWRLNARDQHVSLCAVSTIYVVKKQRVVTPTGGVGPA